MTALGRVATTGFIAAAMHIAMRADVAARGFVVAA